MTNRQLALPYLLPYLLYVGIASVPAAWLGVEANYAVRIVLVGAALAWAWRHLGPLTGPASPAASAVVGVGAGLVGTVVWVALVNPFVDGGAAWSGPAFWLRLVAAGTLVPLFEELAMRGYVLRFGVQWDELRRAKASDPFGEAVAERCIHDVAPGGVTVFAVAVSTAAFTLGHTVPEMPAAIAYGLLMAALWIWRKDLLTCIVAHATTNVALACYVRATAAWALW